MADNWEKYDISHEKRVLFVNGVDVKADEHQNLHIIPANESVYKGFATIKRGDIIRIKGYLIDWHPFDADKTYKTALSFKESSWEKVGGSFSYLCMQFFVTELYASGYIFR